MTLKPLQQGCAVSQFCRYFPTILVQYIFFPPNCRKHQASPVVELTLLFLIFSWWSAGKCRHKIQCYTNAALSLTVQMDFCAASSQRHKYGSERTIYVIFDQDGQKMSILQQNQMQNYTTYIIICIILGFCHYLMFSKWFLLITDKSSHIFFQLTAGKIRALI